MRWTPGLGAKTPYASWPKNQNMEQYCNKFSEDLKNGPLPQKKDLKKNSYPC